MKILFNFIFIMALVFFTLSFAVHLSTFSDYNIQKDLPYIWVIHVCIFALLLPLLLSLNKYDKNKDFMDSTPPWFKSLWALFLIYALLNFIVTLFVLKEGCDSSIIDWKYYLTSKSNIVREITREEYEKNKIYDVRLFSGHWMFFYIFIAGTAYSVISDGTRKTKKSRKR